VVAGSPYHASAHGAAYVFVMPPGGWPATAHQTAELTANDGAIDVSFGHSVAISGHTVVAGAPGHSDGLTIDQGAAYVFVMPPAG
jgi:hypothetical protein